MATEKKWGGHRKGSGRKKPLQHDPEPVQPVAEASPEQLAERAAESARRDEEQRKWWAQTDAERAAYWRAQRAAIYPDEDRVTLLPPDQRIKYYDPNLTPDDRRAFLAKEFDRTLP